MDETRVQQCAEGLALTLPRGRHRGRAGERRAAQAGASSEIHDWRAYQPGDDVRAIDWNAVARTDELILRLREDEVSPRVEVLLDGSKSMAIHPAKGARAQELALLCCVLALRQSLQVTLTVLAQRPERAEGSGCAPLLRRVALDGVEDLQQSLRRAPPFRPCGLRVVVSDFLLERPMDDLVGQLARNAAGLSLVQVLATEDLEPPVGVGARLIDSESGAGLEQLLDAELLRAYAQRLEQHQKLLRAAAQRARAWHTLTVAEQSMESALRQDLFPLIAPLAAEVAWP